MSNETETTAKRNAIATVVYLDKNGEESRTAHDKVTSIVWKWSDGEITSVDIAEIPAKIQKAAMVHGLRQKIGDSYAGASSAEEAREGTEKKSGFLTVVELLKAGDWVKEREGGTARPSLLLEAIERSLLKSGVPASEITEERRAKWRETLSTKEGRDKTRANPTIDAEYKLLQAERAAERAARAAKQAEQAPTDSDALAGF